MNTFDKNVARPNLFHVVMHPPSNALDSRQLIKGTAKLTIRDWIWNSRVQVKWNCVFKVSPCPARTSPLLQMTMHTAQSYEMANGISYAEEIEVTYILDSDHRVKRFL